MTSLSSDQYLNRVVFTMNISQYYPSATREDVEAQNQKIHVKPATKKKAKNPVGRPRKIAQVVEQQQQDNEDAMPALESETETETAAVCRQNWWQNPYLLLDIIMEVLIHRSFTTAIANLQHRFPRAKFERYGRFDKLSRSTVQAWFERGDDGQFLVKQSVASRLEDLGVAKNLPTKLDNNKQTVQLLLNDFAISNSNSNKRKVPNPNDKQHDDNK